jgi:hypothetical protein
MDRFGADVNAETLAAAVLRDGFAIVDDVLPDAATDRIAAGLRAMLLDQPPGANSFVGYKTKRIFSVLAKSRIVDELVIHPLVLGVLDTVLDKYQLSAPVVIEIEPGERAQTLHRDSTTYPLAQHEHTVVVNVMWAFDDIMGKGSMCVFLGSIVHGGGANASEAPRLGVTMEYAAAWLRPQENFALSVPRDTARQLPLRLAELIGYDLYPPFLGYVDGRNPRELLTGPVTA